MAKIVEPPKTEQVTCSLCKAVMEYTPNEVETYSGMEHGFEDYGYIRVKCPWPGCSGHGYVGVW